MGGAWLPDLDVSQWGACENPVLNSGLTFTLIFAVSTMFKTVLTFGDCNRSHPVEE